jgi:hypothetical protein
MKQHQRFSTRVVGLLFAILLLLPIASCRTSAPTDAQLQAAYRNAVADAQIAEPDEICGDLEAIVYYNPDLTWEGQPGDSPVLLLTWTGWDGYNDRTDETMTASRDIWTIIPKQLKDFCEQNRSLTGDRLVLRLEELYGLPPHDGKKWLVEIWANPDDVFRPSPDPDITDHEAELDFPGWVDAQYRDWFNTLRSKSYGENGYPWTRLGYTYDWGNPKSEVGLSEFIIRAGATMQIHSVSGTLEYCRN